MRKQIQVVLLSLWLVFFPGICNAKMILGLEKDFIEKVKDKATISTRFNIDAVPSKADPHSIGEGSNDGDIHMAGHDSVVKLPLVAEIMNARKEDKPLKFLKALFNEKRFGEEVDLIGVWRIWFEHLSNKPQLQNEPFPAPTNSGAPHAFELHPVTSFNGFDCKDSFIPIKSATKTFKGFPASQAFPAYEKLQTEITMKGTQVRIEAGLGQLNYADFVMELNAKPKSVGDGFIVTARVFDSGNEDTPVIPLARRMIFAKDTAPANAVRDLKKGDRLHVLGVPRVDLHAVFGIVQKFNPTNEKFSGKLPYEMIIVAVLE